MKAELVDQPPGVVLRKIMIGFWVSWALVFVSQTLPQLYPFLVDPQSPWSGLYDQLRTWALLAGSMSGYYAKEWGYAGAPPDLSPEDFANLPSMLKPEEPDENA